MYQTAHSVFGLHQKMLSVNRGRYFEMFLKHPCEIKLIRKASVVALRYKYKFLEEPADSQNSSEGVPDVPADETGVEDTVGDFCVIKNEFIVNIVLLLTNTLFSRSDSLDNIRIILTHIGVKIKIIPLYIRGSYLREDLYLKACRKLSHTIGVGDNILGRLFTVAP